LTAATEEGRNRIVMCLDRASGQILWKEVAWTGEPEPTHGMNMFASATCATDGERVVAFFGRGGVHCYDLEGKKLWSRDLGQFEGPWGTAASPLLYRDLVIQNCDAEDNASIVGLDLKTGKTVWETPRERLRGWSSPLLVETPKRVEVVVNGERGVNAYDPQTGKELWFCQGDRGRGAPTVTRYEDILITVSGRPGAMFAMKPGGSGTINKTHEVWRTIRKGGRDLPSPIVIGKYLIVVSLRPGLATCYEAATGQELDRVRLEGNFSASPLAANGLAYIPNEAGEVVVLKPGDKLEVVATNKIQVGDEEVFRASLTPNQGELLMRSDRVLYCIAK
jgi:outer membrane protein assembly factor BamB